MLTSLSRSRRFIDVGTLSLISYVPPQNCRIVDLAALLQELHEEDDGSQSRLPSCSLDGAIGSFRIHAPHNAQACSFCSQRRNPTIIASTSSQPLQIKSRPRELISAHTVRLFRDSGSTRCVENHFPFSRLLYLCDGAGKTCLRKSITLPRKSFWICPEVSAIAYRAVP